MVKKKKKRIKNKGAVKNRGGAQLPLQKTSVHSTSQTPSPNSQAAVQSVPEVQLQPFGEGPRFTVLMAAYNRADLIGVAIQSVLEQDFKDFELVIVDDGSTDGTPTVVSSFQDERIRYIRKQTNEGRSPTRNRAISEAKGEYVLWMADDDLLMPGVLTLYDETLRQDPSIDVIYGNLQLFDHDTGRDLNLFEPNDWTDRDRAIIGAKLYGSCVPDGGTANRRTIYAQVGPGPYDAEFVRAQDYELWTRIVGQAKFRKVDATVYRYRKHSGGTSWGEFIDLTLDSKIIRRHLNRHPLSVLFSQLDWTFPGWATAQAYLRIAKNLRMYGDHKNASRFIAAIPGWSRHPEAIEVMVKAQICRGDLAGAQKCVDSIDSVFGHKRTQTQSLQSFINACHQLAAEMTDTLDAADPHNTLQSVTRFVRAHEMTYHAALFRGRAHLALNNREEALHNFCLAARLNTEDTEAQQLMAPLVDEFGRSPKTDLTAMRRRLNETFVDLPIAVEPHPEHQPLVSIIIVPSSSADLRRSLRSIAKQGYGPIEVLLPHQYACEVDQEELNALRMATSRPSLAFKSVSVQDSLEPYALHRAAMVSVSGQYTMWLVDGCIMYPNCLTTAVAALNRGAHVAMLNGHYMRYDSGPDERVSESFYFPEAVFQDAPILVSPILSMSMFVYRTGHIETLGGFPDAPHADWVFAVHLRRHANIETVVDPSISIPLKSEQDREISPQQYLEIYRCFGRYSAFDPVTRDAQNAQIAPVGFLQASQGRTTIVLVMDDNAQEMERCIESIDKATMVPFDLVISVPRDDETGVSWVSGIMETRDDVRDAKAPSGAKLAKRVNVGLARANGEFVVVVTRPVQVTRGWLGRLQWLAKSSDNLGILCPSFLDSKSDSQWLSASRKAMESRAYHSDASLSLDSRLFLCTREALDRVGGFDVTLNSGCLDFYDFAHRVRLGGFSTQVTSDVIVGTEHIEQQASTLEHSHFHKRWSKRPCDLGMGENGESVWTDEYFCPAGAEEGYRPDTFQLQVLEAGMHNCLVFPPWPESDLMVSLVKTLSQLPADVTIWLKTSPGEGHQRMADLLEICRQFAVDIHAQVLMIDAYLAPDREGGLYTRAGMVWADESWPESRQVMRRAVDCGCTVFTTPTEVLFWASESLSR